MFECGHKHSRANVVFAAIESVPEAVDEMPFVPIPTEANGLSKLLFLQLDPLGLWDGVAVVFFPVEVLHIESIRFRAPQPPFAFFDPAQLGVFGYHGFNATLSMRRNGASDFPGVDRVGDRQAELMARQRRRDDLDSPKRSSLTVCRRIKARG